MSITSTLPIVAERAMWWGAVPMDRGQRRDGSDGDRHEWAIGESAEGGASQEATFVLVANASSTAGTVRVTVVYDDGTSEQKDYTLLGHARLTVRIGARLPPGWRTSGSACSSRA